MKEVIKQSLTLKKKDNSAKLRDNLSTKIAASIYFSKMAMALNHSKLKTQSNPTENLLQSTKTVR